jgi:hypothetical protein
MTSYRNRLINYVEIEPKESTTADKGKFRAIGRGDMKVTLPNGHRNTKATILWKDVCTKAWGYPRIHQQGSRIGMYSGVPWKS